MDRELVQLVRAIKAGTIQDADHVRDILWSAKDAIDRKMKRLDAQDKLLLEATEAFVRGWRDNKRSVT